MPSASRTFFVNGYQLLANEWHAQSAHKVLALHGWLDNAASFDVLAPLLNDCHIVALDLPGHGLSDHKHQQATYNIWDDLLDILAVADAMGWEKFTLLGHSRGAIISVLLAAAAPARIDSLILLDGIFAEPVKVEDTATQLTKFIATHRAVSTNTGTVYHSIEQAVDVRCKATSISPQSARPIVERGIMQVEGGYSWRTDPRLLAASAVKMTEQQSLVLLTAVQAPLLLLVAEQGLGVYAKELEGLSLFDNIEQHWFAGSSHHFHMEQQVGDIVARIKHFFCNV